MSVREPVAGDVIAGRYRLLEPLGRGGMGAVWKAEHLTLRSPVAVKLIHARSTDNEELRARFAREAQASASLRSPHVVQVLDHGVEDGVPFIVMELLEGESLGDRLRRLGVLSPAETARMVTHVARALEKAHAAGIVHRDLKPDNVFLVQNADEEIAKVLDFGIAKVAQGFGQAEAATQTGAVLGSPHYMSPEQARGTRTVDHRTDIWALGVIAFQCLTGRRPFESDVLGDLLLKICAEPIPVPSTVAQVPHGFDGWCAHALERDPDRRFQSVRHAAESLRELVGLGSSLASSAVGYGPTSAGTYNIGPQSVAPPSLVEPIPSQAGAPRRSKAAPVLLALAVIGGGLFGLAAVIAAYLYFDREPELSPVAAPLPALGEPSAAPSSLPSASSRSGTRAPVKAGAGPSPTGTLAKGDGTTLQQLKDAEQKIKDAEQKVKAAEQKVKAAEEKAKAAGVE